MMTLHQALTPPQSVLGISDDRSVAQVYTNRSEKGHPVMWELYTPGAIGKSCTVIAGPGGSRLSPVYIKDPSTAHPGVSLFQVSVGCVIVEGNSVEDSSGTDVEVSAWQIEAINPHQFDGGAVIVGMISRGSFNGRMVNGEIKNLVGDMRIKDLLPVVEPVLHTLAQGLTTKVIYTKKVSSGIQSAEVKVVDSQEAIAGRITNLTKYPVKFKVCGKVVAVLPPNKDRLHCIHKHTGVVSIGDVGIPIVRGVVPGASEVPYIDGHFYIVTSAVAAVAGRDDFLVQELDRTDGTTTCLIKYIDSNELQA